MDLNDTITPNSEQINADDLLSGERTVTITAVEAGTKDQPVFVHVAEIPGRTYRPAKSMRRVLIAAWGTDSSAYIGRRLTLFNDTEVLWGGKPVGGVRISAMSDIPEALSIGLTVTRGRRAPFIVQPLDSRDWLAELELAELNVDAIEALGVAAKKAHVAPTVMAAIVGKFNAAKDAAQ
jgi:hypothetical protein